MSLEQGSAQTTMAPVPPMQAVLPQAHDSDTQTPTTLGEDLKPDAPSAPVETAPKEEPKKEEDPRLTRKFTELARRQKEIENRERNIKTQLAPLEAPEYKAFLEAKKTKNPIKLIESLGYSYEDATHFILNDQKPTVDKTIQQLQEEIANLKKSQEDERASAEEKNNAKIIENHQRDIKAFVDSQGDSFELIREYGRYDEVWNQIQMYWDAHGEILPLEEAAKHVEAHYEKEAKRVMGLKKFAPKVEPKAENSDLKPSESPKTLTNKLNSVQSPSPAPYEDIDDEESKARSAKFLEQALRERGKTLTR
jgi:hypothetical protein